MLGHYRHTRWYQTLWHWREYARNHEYRLKDRDAMLAFKDFVSTKGGAGLRANVRPARGATKTVLIASQAYLPFAKIEALLIKAFQMAGFETVVMGNRRVDFLRYGWLAGNASVLESYDLSAEFDLAWVNGQAEALNSLHAWLDLEYAGVHVGRFAVASAMRSLKVGQLDFGDVETKQTLRRFLEYSVYHAAGVARIFDRVKPDAVLVMDRGYAGYGETFDLAISRGVDALTWLLGYKSNRLVLKRFNSGNDREHPLSPSTETWRQLTSLPWKPDYGERVRQELFQCYEKQDWFSVVGTQFGKQILSATETKRKLGLDPEVKVAVVFPHILWDGSFFYGRDLFNDYTEWFVETIRAAAANPRLQWVVKLHPAHVVKAKQGNDTKAPSELRVIESVFGTLPSHITLVHPDTQISTYSLFEIADYAVTVRGTVGIEAALFGIPVVTAGTGRYDRRGFTLDSTTREEYLDRLARLETYPRLTPAQIELAERYAYGTFLGRPLALSSASLEFARDEKATPEFTVKCQTREDWLRAPDMRRLAAWLADGKQEDMLLLPDAE